ncbi:peptidoglycan-binding protein LysM [Streptomyces longispororuber]|uniref:Peptidoglycan-binding protein LysM n=1 Tax=Streptomyces longispororuber TaxID=68230 RepID=A0A919DWI9_9ACTN|nr:transglycosylase family protein [Streptomyces longispororuber]GHE85921.1 peptidoglycan-binding protein LysM [Streptomyces longispororuber]
MLSGQGRHRRPRQAPAILVAVGVTGSAIALPLLGATSANAADAETWDKVADCESGGAWSAKGSGYYGGLQLTQETWEQYGGLSYAPSADQASRSQQIAIAENVLRDQGPDAWPNCAPAAGLTKGGEAADVDPGLPSTPPSKGSDGSSGDDGASGRDADRGSGKDADDEPSGADSDTRDKNHDTGETPDQDASDRAGTGKHRKPGDSGDSADSGDSGRTAPEGSADRTGGDGTSAGGGATSPDDTDASDASGGSDGPADGSSGGSGTPGSPGGEDADRPSGRHRGEPAGDDASSGGEDAGAGRHASRGEARQKPGAGSGAQTYTVRSGDNLSAIADTHGLDGGWTSLYAENKKTVGSDPDLILPGQRLELDEKTKAGTKEKSGAKHGS